MSQEGKFKSGFVAIIGRSNVGKSTIMNRLVGQKVAITSNKPQTTRNRISGIYTADNMQVIFIDTPGIFKPHSELDNYMDQASLSSLNDVDLVLFMVTPHEISNGDRYVARLLEKIKAPVFLVINKIDTIHPDKLLPIIDSYRKLRDFSEILPVSAIKSIGITDLFNSLYKYLPTGPQYYGSDQITDRPEYFVVAELIREQILRLTSQEVPHATAVAVDQMNQLINGKLQIEATIYVERDGQKGIIIGKSAQMLKKIGIVSRKQIENLLGEKINLRLWVKIRHNWRSDSSFLKLIGYDKKDFS